MNGGPLQASIAHGFTLSKWRTVTGFDDLGRIDDGLHREDREDVAGVGQDHR